MWSSVYVEMVANEFWYLCVLGDGRSMPLPLLGGLSPCTFPPFSDGVWAGLPFIDPPPHSESETTALALALSFSFSLSVWLTGLGMPRPPGLLSPVPEPCPEPGSLSLEPCDAATEGLMSPEPVSMVVLTGRAELGRVKVRVLVFAGRGRERYCRDVLAFGDRKPLWSLLETSRLVFRPPPPAPGFTGIPDVLGIFPTVAEPLGMPLLTALVTLGGLELFVLLLVAAAGFLKPKFPPVEGLTRPDGGLRCSAAPVPFRWSLPASEEERWRLEVFTAKRDLSMGFPSDFTVPKAEKKKPDEQLEQSKVVWNDDWN